MTIDRLLYLVPSEISVCIDGDNFNAFAFVDDLIFLASTPEGL